MISINNLTKISDHEWEIPQTFRADMLAPVRIFATRELLEQIMDDKSLEQAVNAATLPGLVGHVVIMPDMHQGYGFPIGGVAATEFPQGVISPGGIGYDINCLTGDAEILHSHGYVRHISEVVSEKSETPLRCLNIGKESCDNASPVRWISQRPRTPLVCVSTQSGKTITATADHPFWTPDGMVTVGRLKQNDAVAVSPFKGVNYEEPSDQEVVSEKDFEDYLKKLGKTSAGNSIAQIQVLLRKRNLLPLTYRSMAIPYLSKIIGFLFGDGTVRFDKKSGKGTVAFYGQANDLEDIRRDIAMLGFRASRVWSRQRQHRIQTTYDTYEFENTEHWCTVNSTALAALLGFLGVPLGNKAKQDYDAPAWLDHAPLWQKRLFLAALFGAEMSAPQTVTGHDRNFGAPTVSMNKRHGFETSGKQFLQHIAMWLREAGIATRPIGSRFEQKNQDGSHSTRLRLSVEADTDNLIRLWSTVGFEYNRSRRAGAAAAVRYLAAKQQLIQIRQSTAQQARSMADAQVPRGQIFAQLVNENTNQRFIERSLYERRHNPARIHNIFPTFTDFKKDIMLGVSGFVWDRIASIELLDNSETVYDFTINHPDHNFIANGFVVSNCGVRLLASSIEADAAAPHMNTLATLLNQYCPSGVGKEGVTPARPTWRTRRRAAASKGLIPPKSVTAPKSAVVIRLARSARGIISWKWMW
jgi:tRNA-splicing ligase RtcB